MAAHKTAHMTIPDPPPPVSPVKPTPPPLGNPDHPDPNGGDGVPNPDNDNLSGNDEAAFQNTLRLFRDALKTSSEPKRRKTKAKEPDTFDGSDPQKLNSFLLQCVLFFRGNQDYCENEDKVTFTLSYLRGAALDHFELDILFPEDLPDWLYNFGNFVVFQ